LVGIDGNQCSHNGTLGLGDSAPLFAQGGQYFVGGEGALAHRTSVGGRPRERGS